MENFDALYGMTLYLSRKDPVKIFISLDPFGCGGYGDIKINISYPLQMYLGTQVDYNFQKQARRRLLNLPVLLALTNLILWTVASIVFMPLLYFISNMGVVSGIYIVFRGVIIGLMASFISFFLIDDYSRKTPIPYCGDRRYLGGAQSPERDVRQRTHLPVNSPKLRPQRQRNINGHF